MFIVDYNGNLIDVPVLITNFMDINGQTPNQGSDQSTWRLVRRFFMYDTKSGVEGPGNYVNGGISTVVRYPQSVTITIQLDPNDNEMIYPPFLTITYRERTQTGVT